MRRLPPLHALRAFEAAACYLSFQNAAAELHVTPTAISHQVRLLEEVCGHELFRRRPRPITLTAAGQALFPALRDALDRMAGALASLRPPDARSVRVSTTALFDDDQAFTRHDRRSGSQRRPEVVTVLGRIRTP
jgi:LysR family glycine cleavage system transcriptional activator